MDHYTTLGVSKDADQATIKQAYRKLAMQHHPDRGGDPQQFQKLTDAYEILGDIGKRAEYDNPQRFGGFPPNFSFNTGGFDNSSLEALLNLLRQQTTNQQQHQQQVLRTQVYISLADSYHGSPHVMSLNTQQGVKVITLGIPKGIESGDQVRYDNIVDNAILIVQFLIQTELKFDRNGNDLTSGIPISVLDLIVGTKIEFTTLAGKKLKVDVKPYTQPTEQVRIKGHGMPIRDSGVYGDQILLLKPYIPTNISQDVIDSIIRNNNNQT
jgi:curved DNA-binding protein